MSYNTPIVYCVCSLGHSSVTTPVIQHKSAESVPYKTLPACVSVTNILIVSSFKSVLMCYAEMIQEF